MTRNLSKLFLLGLILLLGACGGGDEGVIGTGFDGKLKVSGAAQKGPFILGTTVLISELSKSGEETNKTIVTQTKDNLGNFEYTLDNPALLQMVASGYHFNEITGELSNSTLSLRAIYDASSNQEQVAYINSLTHLIHKRVIKLLVDGKTSAEAISQAQSELITVLEPVFPVQESIGDFTQFNLFDTDSENDLGNAYLLALSSSFYQFAINRAAKSNNVDAELSLGLNNFADDLSDNGIVDNAKLVEDLKKASKEVDIKRVTLNLKKLSEDNQSETLLIPDMNLVMDSDGDGILNFEDEDVNGDGIKDVDAKGMFSKQIGEGFEWIEIVDIIESKASGFIAIGRELVQINTPSISDPYSDPFDTQYGEPSYIPKPFVTYIDEEGYTLSSNWLEFEGFFSAMSISLADNDEPVILGSYFNDNDFPEVEEHLLVFQYDRDQDIAWEFKLEGVNFLGNINKINKVADGYIISTFQAASPYLVKINNSGQQQWELKLDEKIENSSSISYVGSDSVGNIQVIGDAKIPVYFESEEEARNNGYYFYETVKIDGNEALVSEGRAVFTASLDNDGENFNYSIHSSLVKRNSDTSGITLSDDSFIVSIHNTENNKLAKINSQHELLWEKHVPELRMNINPPMLLSNDNFAFISGYDFGTESLPEDRGFLLVKFDENANKIEESKNQISLGIPTFRDSAWMSGHAYLNKSIATYDGGFFMSVHKQGWDWLIKTSPNGTIIEDLLP